MSNTQLLCALILFTFVAGTAVYCWMQWRLYHLPAEAYETGVNGILAMPTYSSIPNPNRESWKLTICPVCGEKCWETAYHRATLKATPDIQIMCSLCAMTRLAKER